MSDLLLRNQQRTLQVNTRFLKTVVLALFNDLLALDHFDVAIHVVGPRRMADINQRFLQHTGPTDVITFPYDDASPQRIQGEIFLCPTVARENAAAYGVPWTRELTRYVVHGTLHLQGFDDIEPESRGRMKRRENSLLAALARRFDLAQVEALN